VRRVAGRLVTTVFDLLLAQYGVARDGLPGQWPTGYDDPTTPGTPAWQEELTNVPAAQAARIGREFADNAERSGGRSMILMGAGTNHWFHSDTIYRTFLALTTMTGCQGVNGGGWAHYVGQEKVRPITGYSQYATAADWNRPPRQNIGTAFWYLASDQWRYDGLPASALASRSPAASSRTGRRRTASSSRSSGDGCRPTRPSRATRSTCATRPRRPAKSPPRTSSTPHRRVAALRGRRPRRPGELPARHLHLASQRAGLVGQGQRVLPQAPARHRLGRPRARVARGSRPRDMVWHENAPEGKLDLLMTADFRMTSTTLFSDLVLPAATWYEKYDLSSTDMHPFIHAFTPAIDPPWQTRTDFDLFGALAEKFSEYAAVHLGVRKDVVASPLQHDTPDVMATPHGTVPEDAPLVPGVTMAKLIVVERDYPNLYERWKSLGPLTAKLGMTTKAITYHPDREIEQLKQKNGVVQSGPYTGSVLLDTDKKACEMILAFSGTSNGRLAVQGFRELEKKTGQRIAQLAETTRARTSPSRTFRCSRAASSPRRSGRAPSTAAVATPRSRSTSST
jgi:nitrate reductase alpha subunit